MVPYGCETVGDFFAQLKRHFHANMRDIRLFKSVSDGMESEFFVEWHGVQLCMESEDGGIGHLCLSACFGDEGVDEACSEALMSDCGKHATNAEDGVVGNVFVFVKVERGFGFFAEEACVGNDLSTARYVHVRSEVVDIILIEVDNALFLRKDGIPGFEDLIEFGCREIGKRADMQFVSFG